jgi:uncharacterized protein (DUF1800 family)
MELLRGSIHSLIAIALCYSLCFPAPIALAQEAAAADQPGAQAHPQVQAQREHRQTYVSGHLEGDERILQALDRFTFGPKPGDLEAVRQMGLDKWFDQQLHPGSIDETDLNAKLAQFPAMQWSTQDLLYRLPSNAMIRMAINGRAPIPAQATLHAVYENQIYRTQARKAAKEEKKDNTATAPGAPSANAQSPAMAASTGAANDMDAYAAKAQPATGTATMAETQQDKNNMAPAASDQASELSEQQIQEILKLEPEQRVLKLQEMQPADFESFMKALRPPQRQALTAGMNPGLRESVEDLEHPEQTVAQELFATRLAHDIYSNAQLQEVMTDFWLNHFNIYLRKNEQMPYYLVSYERDVIRPHALGKFEDLLEAVAHSPAMMIYLDNAESVGPDSPAAERAKMGMARRPSAKRQDPPGINENYARELMELHTVGVNGGYTQADVIQVARVLTGWTVDRPQFGGGFQFNPNRHEPGTDKVMGVKFKDNGEMQGRELLHFLATRPATAQFISRKLAVRFVSDDPPKALVDRMANTYMSTGGDIPSVLKTLFHSPEFWAASNYRAKVKTPLEFVVSAARASDAQIENYMPLVNALRQLGMPLYGCIPPVGYKWDAADWVSTGALVDRMNFALSLAGNRLPGITVDWAPDLDMSALDSDEPAKQVIPTPESEETRLEPMLLPGGVSATTREAALEEFQKENSQNSAEMTPVSERPAQMRRANRAPAANVYQREDQLLAGLLMGSPEFQRR